MIRKVPARGWKILKFFPVIPWLEDCCKEYRCEIRPSFKRKTWLLNLVIFIFFTLYCLTANKFLRANLKKYLGYGRWQRCKYKFVECYVVIWLAAGLIFLFRLGAVPDLTYCRGFLTLVTVLLMWRLLDLLQAWFNVAVLRIDPSPYSAPRMLVLNLVGFFEVIVIFGIFAFFAEGALLDTSNQGFQDVWQSLYYSVATITTIGSDYTPVDSRGYLLFYGEIAFGVLFLVVVIQWVLSLFPRR